MQKLLITLFLLQTFSCSKKSEIEAFSKSRSLREKINSSKVNIKFPLTEVDLGYFEPEDILGERKSAIVSKIVRNMRESAYTFGVEKLKKGKFKTDVLIELPEEIYPYVRSIKLKRVFFNLDTCIKKDCRKIGKKASLSWVNTISAALVHDENLSGLGELEVIGSDQFKKELFDFNQNFEGKRSFKSKKDYVALARALPAKRKKEFLDNYYLLKGTDRNLREMNVYLEKHKNELNLKDVSIYNNTLLLETFDNMAAFRQKLLNNPEVSDLFSRFGGGVNLPQKCHTNLCIDLEVNEEELIHFLRDKRELKVSSLFDINKLPKTDIKFKGFIELSLELDPEAIY